MIHCPWKSESVYLMTPSCHIADNIAAVSILLLDHLHYADITWSIISLPSSAVLFLIQVKAVYYDNRNIAIFFGLLWFALFILNLLVLVCRDRANPMAHCPSTRFGVLTYDVGPQILIIIFDTLIFIAISFVSCLPFKSRVVWELMPGCYFKEMGSANFQGCFYKGGKYTTCPYLFPIFIAITLILASIAWWITQLIVYVCSNLYDANRVSDTVSGFLTQPSIALQSAMACCVFRQIRIGLITEFDSTSKNTTALCFAQQPIPLAEMTSDIESSCQRLGLSNYDYIIYFCIIYCIHIILKTQDTIFI